MPYEIKPLAWVEKNCLGRPLHESRVPGGKYQILLGEITLLAFCHQGIGGNSFTVLFDNTRAALEAAKAAAQRHHEEQLLVFLEKTP